MLIVIFIISLILLMGGVFLFENTRLEVLGVVSTFIGTLAGIISFIAFIVGVVNLIGYRTLDLKIEFYTQENVIIQEDINSMVSEYMKWESDTYEKFANSDPTIVINLYPDLKSNELVVKQLEIYLQNKEEIKRLKTQKITADVWKWWVYFG